MSKPSEISPEQAKSFMESFSGPSRGGPNAQVPQAQPRGGREAYRAGFCRHFASGMCQFGNKCDSSHDSEGILKWEEKWQKCEAPYDKVTLPADADRSKLQQQEFDYLAVVDMGSGIKKEEISQFAVLLVDTRQNEEAGRFHCFVRPPSTLFNIPERLQSTEDGYKNAKCSAKTLEECLRSFEDFLLQFDIDVNCGVVEAKQPEKERKRKSAN
jgi:hypothetical protein